MLVMIETFLCMMLFFDSVLKNPCCGALDITVWQVGDFSVHGNDFFWRILVKRCKSVKILQQ